VAIKFEWTNKLRVSTTLIRQLEFSLARLESRLDENLTALQFLVNRKITLNFVPPSVLMNILVNVSLSLPEGCELTDGLPDPDLRWYYFYVTINVLVSSMGFLLFLSIPLNAVTTQFELFNIFVFPSEVYNTPTCNFIWINRTWL
jgi:hypothetical protein